MTWIDEDAKCVGCLYCCITDCLEISSFRQHTCIISQILWVWAGFSWVLCEDAIEVLCRTEVSWMFGEISASKLIYWLVLCSFKTEGLIFLLAVGLKPLWAVS